MRIAVLGLGSIGLRHARNLMEFGHEVIGFDPDPKRGVEVGRANSRAEALSAASAAIIASPNDCHLEDLNAALQQGLHVFVEKPPAHTADGLAPLVARAEENSLVFFTGVNLRVCPVVREARTLIQAGEIGDPIWGRFLGSSWLPGWRPDQNHTAGYTADPRTGGVLFDYYHEFDLAVHLLGDATPIAASARTTGLVSIASDDCADALLRHDGGVQSTIHVDYVSRVPSRTAEIAGTKGLLRLDLNNRLLEHTPAEDERRVTRYEGDFSSDYVEEMRTFLECIQGDQTPPCGGREALRVLELVVAIREMCGLPA